MKRRNFLGSIALNALSASSAYHATGTRVGEVTHNSATAWTRLTQHPTRNTNGVLIPGRTTGKTPPVTPTVPADQLEGACPPASGRIRLAYSTDANLKAARRTPWVDVSAAQDGIHSFHLKGLKPATTYYYAAESSSSFRGSFQTAPEPNATTPVRFCVMTCQAYPDRGHTDGHAIYPAMQAAKPNFAVLTGDLVYLDEDQPRATSQRLARYHWERMFSLPRLVEFNRHTSTYWLKDDHDTLTNDSWPGLTQGELTFEQGQRIYNEQAPLNDGPAYRTFRWGRDLQIWFSEGRDNRSPNSMPDGPTKTIWGAAQKAWFQKSVLASDATFKILVSPTPFVGPDRKAKADNHANEGFTYEGNELRDWFATNLGDNFLVICGDRHWQYHSVHPRTGLNEFSVGPASDEHAGGTPGENKAIHRFHRVKGGFLYATVERKGSQCHLNIELRDVDGHPVYNWTRQRPV